MSGSSATKEYDIALPQTGYKYCASHADGTRTDPKHANTSASDRYHITTQNLGTILHFGYSVAATYYDANGSYKSTVSTGSYSRNYPWLPQ